MEQYKNCILDPNSSQEQAIKSVQFFRKVLSSGLSFSIMLLSRPFSSNRSRYQYRHYSCYMQLSFFWWLPWTSIWIGLGPNQYLFRNKRTSNILSLFSLDCCCSWCWCSWSAYSSYWISIDGCSWTSDMGLR